MNGPVPLCKASVWRAAVILFVALAAALVIDNYDYFFRAELNEFEDLAVNSLQIIRAKHFHELYGQYSRWGFHHPGPAFFYVQAWGEMLFYDWLRLVPRPLNAQMLVSLLLNVFFISTSLATAAGWVGRRTVFLPLALLLGALHAGAIKFPFGVPLGALFLLGNWPDFTIVLPFAAMIVVGASVAAGRAASLPLFALACCFLEHAHVAQPLFIVPLALLAYGGLIFSFHRDADAALMDTNPLRRGWRTLTAPWRAYPRTHVLSAGIIAVFLLPILIDACAGRGSNLAQILAFRHAHAAEKHKRLIRSFLYFVQYALYGLYDPAHDVFGAYTARGMNAYLQAHRVVAGVWLTSVAGSLAVMSSWLRPARGPAALRAVDEAMLIGARRRYAAWLWVFVAAAFVLTLVWGVIMNGEMLYYNAFFNYGLCYAAMLAVAAVAADYLAQAGHEGSGRAANAFLYVLLAAVCAVETGDFRVGLYARYPAYGMTAHGVDAALRAETPTTRPRMLSFTPDVARTRAVEIALALERRGVPYLVEKPYEFYFGHEHVVDDPFRNPPDPEQGPPFRTWQILTPNANMEPGTRFWPLDPERILLLGEREIDPAANVVISFGEQRANYINLAPLGWGPPQAEPPFLWSIGAAGQLSFRAHPVAATATVRLTFGVIPLIAPGKLDAQRMEISFNGVPAGTWTRGEAGNFDLTLPAAVWNAQPDAWLTFRYPDAAVPRDYGVSPETRRLAFAFHQIIFRLE